MEPETPPPPRRPRSRWHQLRRCLQDDATFLHFVEFIEGLVSRVLSVAMIAVILVALVDLVIVLTDQVASPPVGFFSKTLQDIFGSFLSILIALEILENITAYLRRHVVQVELVVATSLTAVARKIIILDLDKVDGTQLIGLAIAILALAISYWLVRISTAKPSRSKPPEA